MNRLLITLSCLTIGCISAAFGQVTFAPPVAYAINSYPVQTVTADVNGDGHLDAITTSVTGVNLALSLGNGDGTFNAKTNISVQENTVSINVGDFNKDGKVDIVAAGTYYINILMGNGNGTFAAPVKYLANASSTYLRGLLVADVNGDGNEDIVATIGTYPGTLAVFLGNGNGTFAARVNYNTSTAGAYGIAAGDFNSDTKIDILTGSDNGLASVLLNNGDGTFASAITYSVGSTAKGVVTGDFNQDGKLDFAAANGSQKVVSVFLGNGDATFATKTNYTVGDSRTVVTADFDGDGKLDLLIANEDTNNLSMLLGNGDGTFRPRIDYGSNIISEGMVVKDFNNDGKLDLLASDYFNTANGRLLVFMNISVLPVTWSSISAEVNGDELKVDWRTISEKNNSHFLVQVSTNGKEWTTLGKVNSKGDHGDSSESLSYSMSYPLGKLAFAGFGLLGLLLLPATRNRWAKLAIVVLLIGSVAACSKNGQLLPEVKEEIKTANYIYVRIAQVDFDGSTTYSMIVSPKREKSN